MRARPETSADWTRRVDKRGGMVWVCQTCHPCLVAPSSPSSARSFSLLPPPRNRATSFISSTARTSATSTPGSSTTSTPTPTRSSRCARRGGAPAIRISGQKYGGITTEKEYETYRLVVEFKWGTKTWEPRVERARDSGVLVHCQGPDGGTRAGPERPMDASRSRCRSSRAASATSSSWQARRHTTTPEMTACTASTGIEAVLLRPRHPARRFRNGGRINWWGRDPNWTDTPRLPRRPTRVEKPAGEWNRLEVVCDARPHHHDPQRRRRQRRHNAEPHRGQDQLQSEGAEIFVRRVDLYPKRQ